MKPSTCQLLVLSFLLFGIPMYAQYEANTVSQERSNSNSSNAVSTALSESFSNGKKYLNIQLTNSSSEVQFISLSLFKGTTLVLGDLSYSIAPNNTVETFDASIFIPIESNESAVDFILSVTN